MGISMGPTHVGLQDAARGASPDGARHVLEHWRRCMLCALPLTASCLLHDSCRAVGGSAPGGMPSPEQMKGMEAVMKDPAMLKSMQDMLGSMSPDDLAAMSQQAGINMTPEQVSNLGGTHQLIAGMAWRHWHSMLNRSGVWCQ